MTKIRNTVNKEIATVLYKKNKDGIICKMYVNVSDNGHLGNMVIIILSTSIAPQGGPRI